MITSTFIGNLCRQGVVFDVVENTIKFRAPKKMISQDWIKEIRKNKEGVIPIILQIQKDFLFGEIEQTVKKINAQYSTGAWEYCCTFHSELITEIKQTEELINEMYQNVKVVKCRHALDIWIKKIQKLIEVTYSQTQGGGYALSSYSHNKQPHAHFTTNFLEIVT